MERKDDRREWNKGVREGDGRWKEGITRNKRILDKEECKTNNG